MNYDGEVQHQYISVLRLNCEEANGDNASHATHLSKLLINDSKLEVVAYDVFIESDDEPGGLWESRRFQ